MTTSTTDAIETSSTASADPSPTTASPRTREEILKALSERFAAVSFRLDDTNEQAIIIPPHHLLEVAQFLKNDPSLHFDYNMVITASDWIERVDVVYYFMSYQHLHIVALKVQLPNDALEVDSLCSLWVSANWFEREVYDLFGVHFAGHPDLRRIMMPQDWEGHPLRKNYEHPNFVPIPEKDNPASHTGMGHHRI